MKPAQDFFFVLQLTTSFSPIQMKSAGAKVNVLVRNMRESTMTTTPVFFALFTTEPPCHSRGLPQTFNQIIGFNYSALSIPRSRRTLCTIF